MILQKMNNASFIVTVRRLAVLANDDRIRRAS